MEQETVGEFLGDLDLDPNTEIFVILNNCFTVIETVWTLDHAGLSIVFWILHTVTQHSYRHK